MTTRLDELRLVIGSQPRLGHSRQPLVRGTAPHTTSEPLVVESICEGGLLRAHPSWQAFVEMRHSPIFRIPKEDLVSRIERLVGDGLHGTEARWSEFNSPDWVEAERKDDMRLTVDLDLERTARP